MNKKNCCVKFQDCKSKRGRDRKGLVIIFPFLIEVNIFLTSLKNALFYKMCLFLQVPYIN